MTIAVAERDGIVVTAPPIARWSIGKPITTLTSWLNKQPGFRHERMT